MEMLLSRRKSQIMIGYLRNPFGVTQGPTLGPHLFIYYNLNIIKFNSVLRIVNGFL